MRGLFLRWRKAGTPAKKTPINRTAGNRRARRLCMESLEGRSMMAADSGPSLAAALVDDFYEQNDTLGGAWKLGTLTAPRTLDNLVMADANDWYRFTLATKPRASDSISISLQ